MKNLLILALILFVYSCSSSTSIQQYYVEKSDDPSFLVIDLPTSMLGVDESILNDEEKEALASFQKFHVLLFRKTAANKDQFPDELKTLRSILDSKVFDPLLLLSDPDYTGKLVLQGSVDRPDEIIFFGTSDNGFVVARLIGSKMQVKKAMLLAGVVQRAGALENITKKFSGMF